MARYRITIPYYRAGVLYPGGSIVEIPDEEKPSRTWTKVEDGPQAPVPETAEAPAPRRRRVADSEPSQA